MMDKRAVHIFISNLFKVLTKIAQIFIVARITKTLEKVMVRANPKRIQHIPWNEPMCFNLFIYLKLHTTVPNLSVVSATVTALRCVWLWIFPHYSVMKPWLQLPLILINTNFCRLFQFVSISYVCSGLDHRSTTFKWVAQTRFQMVTYFNHRKFIEMDSCLHINNSPRR